MSKHILVVKQSGESCDYQLLMGISRRPIEFTAQEIGVAVTRLQENGERLEPGEYEVRVVDWDAPVLKLVRQAVMA